MISAARVAAFDVLQAVSSGREDLPSALAQARGRLSDTRDRALCAEIATGVERHRAALDHVIATFARRRIDRLDSEARDRMENAAHRMERRPVPVSALTGEGIDALKAAIEERLAGSRARFRITLDVADGAGVSWLHRNTEVLGKTIADDGQVAMTVRVHPANAQLLQSRFAGRVEADAQIDAGDARQGRAVGVR